MEAARHDYDYYRSLADKARQQRIDDTENIIILIKNGAIQGWCHTLPDPSEDGGIVAVDSRGRIYVVARNQWEEEDVQLSLPLSHL